MADAGRARKVADRIKVLIAANVERIVKDPDLGFVTITDVRVTNDLQDLLKEARERDAAVAAAAAAAQYAGEADPYRKPEAGDDVADEAADLGEADERA